MWWIYGAKMLLHPDCLKLADEVVDELITLADVDGVCNDCWLSTVTRLLSQCSLMKDHIDSIIDKAAEDLIPFNRYILNREFELA